MRRNWLRYSKRFKIIPDETTDVSTAKQLAICVMYVDDDLKPVNRFLDIVEATDSGAKGLYQAMKIVLQEKSILLSNIIGYSSDTCNVIFATCCHHQMQLSYDSSLCISHMPKVVYNPRRFVQEHLLPLQSVLRKKDFEEFQAFVEVQPHKLLKLSQTRWLSLESCVTRVLEQRPFVCISLVL